MKGLPRARRVEEDDRVSQLRGRKNVDEKSGYCSHFSLLAAWDRSNAPLRHSPNSKGKRSGLMPSKARMKEG